MKFEKALGSRMLFVDGGMGTMLQSMGLTGGTPPAAWNLSHPDRVQSVHEAYLQAGCDIVTANTFGVSTLNFGGDAARLVKAGVALARAAVTNQGHGYAALDLGPTGKLLQPFGDLPFEEAVTLFGDMAKAGEEAGADLILIETMSDSYELKAAVMAARERTSLPVIATMMVNENGKLLTGGDIRGMAAMLEGLGVTALGMNCGLGPRQMMPLMEEMLKASSVPVLLCPNAGLPEVENGDTCYHLGPEDFARDMEALGRMGPWLMGGCCGTTPDHIHAMIKHCRDLPVLPIQQKTETVVSSHGKTVVFGGPCVLIGERINPTGKSRLKQALREKDMDYLLREAVSQQQSGVHLLDVNVGLPDVDEAELMSLAVEKIQAITDLPLQLDTADPAVLARALRIFNGKALVNSVSGKKASMDAVFPLVKKYGGTVVALPLDEQGIPDTAEGRIAVARKILDEAQRYGIAKKDILLDGLTLTASSGGDAAGVTLQTIRLAKEELGLHTVLGVSNISFGLPQRERLNAAFFAMALAAGLDGAIINPHSMAMMDTWRAATALCGRDEQFQAYINAYGGQESSPSAAQTAQESLSTAVRLGLGTQAAKAAERLLVQGIAPLSVIGQELIPALDAVGKGFEAGTLFLPQLLMSAEAAKGAFEKLQAALAASGQETVPKGRVLLATVAGDVHDIGKNIVKVLLENYGFSVLDLGKDVPAEQVVEAVLREDIRLVGLSALMTTTVSSMEKTIHALREQKPDCRIMVGGAVLTKDYAEKIGADFYGKDAMASVGYAQQVFAG